MNRFIKNAQKILIGNRKRGYTLPTNNKLYPAQWNWDSAFIALGYSYFNLKFALKEIKTLLDGQWKDGMIPHILFHDTNTNYYPNHTAWNCGNKVRSSGITQPPVLASILKQMGPDTFKNNVYVSHKMNGLNGIKTVLPALVPDFKDAYKDLDLVKNGMTQAVMFGPDGKNILPAAVLYKKNILAIRGSFRPLWQ